MTEKESAHPLSPAADVDKPKESKRRELGNLSEESSSLNKTIVSVSNNFTHFFRHHSKHFWDFC